jgi:hypothetical protein
MPTPVVDGVEMPAKDVRSSMQRALDAAPWKRWVQVPVVFVVGFGIGLLRSSAFLAVTSAIAAFLACMTINLVTDYAKRPHG